MFLKWKGGPAEEVIPRLRWRLWGILFLVPVLCLCEGASKIDDSFIYARYVANALSGMGMVFNAGEHVNALTSPLFAYLLLLVSWLLRGQVLLATVLLSGTFMLLTCLLAEVMVPFAGLLLATTAYFYSLVGMETTTFAFMLLLVVALFQMERYDWLPLASVLLVLTRFEGGLLVALVGWLIIRRRVRPRPLAVLPAVAVGILYLTLNHHFYGGYMPSSATAKLGQGFSGYWGRWPTAFLGHLELLSQVFDGTILLVPILFGLALAGVAAERRQSWRWIVLPFCGLLLLFYVGMNMTGLYFWYFAPFVLFGIMFAARGIPQTRTGMVIGCVLVGLLALSNARFLRAPRLERRYAGYVEAGRWLARNTPAHTRVAAVEIGLLGWYSERFLIDVVGLTTSKNAVHVAHHDLNTWLVEDRPDFILLHQDDWPWEMSAKQSRDYLREPIQFSGGLYLVRRADYNTLLNQALAGSSQPAKTSETTVR